MKMWRLVLVLAVVTAGGCIQADSVLKLNRDGSGSIQLDYTIRERTVEQFEAMHRLREHLDQASGQKIVPSPTERYTRAFFNPTESVFTAILKPYETKGVSVRTLKVDPSTVSREVSLRLDFRNLAALAECDLFKFYGFNLTRDEKEDFLFERPATRPDLTADSNLSNDERVKLLRDALAGFRVTFKAELPGRVIDSNANQKGGRSAIWIFDFNEDPRAFSEMQTKVLRATFESSGLEIPVVRCNVGRKDNA